MQVQFKRIFASILAFSWVLVSAGCGLIEDRSQRYVSAQEGEPLETPEGETIVRKREAYPVRDVENASRARLSPSDIPRPPDTTSEILEENYLVESLDDNTWVLINEVPGRVWPSVSAFLNEKGLGVAHESPQLGLIQSEVANFSRRARELLEIADDESGAVSLVQARVVSGIRRKTTEVQFRVRRLEAAPEELLAWQSQSGSPELERRLLEAD